MNNLLTTRITSLICIWGATCALATSAGATALLEHEFVSSSTGTNVIGLGDTISFESFITIAAGTPVSNVTLSYTGDIDTSLATPVPCVGNLCFQNTAHHVTGWELAGSTATPVGSLGIELVEGPPANVWLSGPVVGSINLGDPVFLAFSALLGNSRAGSFYEGTGQRSLIGTVTITADSYGEFNAGALIYPMVTGVYNAVSRFADGVEEFEIIEIESTVMPISFVTGSFVVTPVPEPSTALLLGSGLVGVCIRQRKKRK